MKRGFDVYMFVIVFTTLVLSLIGIPEPEAGTYSPTLTPGVQINRPGSATVTFTGTSRPAGAGTLTVTGTGDINESGEFVVVTGEGGLSLGTLFDGPNGPPEMDVITETDSLTIPLAALTTLASDGTVAITFTIPAGNGAGNVRLDVVTLTYETEEGEFTINVTTFIPANNLDSAPQAFCLTDSPPRRYRALIFKGDDRTFNPNATSYRTRQLVTVITEKIFDPDGLFEGIRDNEAVPPIGETRAYAPDALSNGVIGKIDAADEDGIPDDCHLWHAAATASDTNMHITVSRINDHAVSAHLFGGASNPLVVGACDISWDFTIRIDTSGSRPFWTVIGMHDGFPAYEIYINGTSAYMYHPGPEPYTTQDLSQLCGGLEIPASSSGML
jgi:Protein of unknown function (DUF3238)